MATLQLFFATFRDEEDRPGGLVAVVHDITKQAKLESTLITAVKSIVKVNGVEGNVYTPISAGVLTIEYIATTNVGQTIKTYTVKAIDATKSATNGDEVMDVAKYFDQNGFVVSADVNGVNFTTTTSDTKATFINYLTSYEFNLDFVINPNKKAFDKLEISLSDVLIKENVLSIVIYVTDGKVEVNGVDTKIKIGYQTLFDTTNRTSTSVSFDARNGVITVSGSKFTIENFIPFTSDIAVLQLAVKDVFGETEFSVRKICNQVLKSTTRKDNIDLSYNGNYGIYMEKGSVLTVYRAVVCDVLSPIKANYVSVYNPDGSVAMATDGTLLNKVSSDRDYEVVLSEYGTYVVDYYVVDDEDIFTVVVHLAVPPVPAHSGGSPR